MNAMDSNSKWKKRNALNIETKLEILNRLAKGESGVSLTQFYNAGKSTISDKKSRETILNFASKRDSEDARRKGKPRGKQTMLFLILHSPCGFHKERAKGNRYRALCCPKKLWSLTRN
ncbi:jerky-like protein [Trichonephila clavipes]|nr:jerky-like protein [Trichonephila clavipes]